MMALCVAVGESGAPNEQLAWWVLLLVSCVFLTCLWALRGAYFKQFNVLRYFFVLAWYLTLALFVVVLLAASYAAIMEHEVDNTWAKVFPHIKGTLCVKKDPMAGKHVRQVEGGKTKDIDVASNTTVTLNSAKCREYMKELLHWTLGVYTELGMAIVACNVVSLVVVSQMVPGANGAVLTLAQQVLVLGSVGMMVTGGIQAFNSTLSAYIGVTLAMCGCVVLASSLCGIKAVKKQSTSGLLMFFVMECLLTLVLMLFTGLSMYEQTHVNVQLSKQWDAYYPTLNGTLGICRDEKGVLLNKAGCLYHTSQSLQYDLAHVGTVGLTMSLAMLLSAAAAFRHRRDITQAIAARTARKKPKRKKASETTPLVR